MAKRAKLTASDRQKLKKAWDAVNASWGVSREEKKKAEGVIKKLRAKQGLVTREMGTRYIVVDSAFNRAKYRSLIGKQFKSNPGYCQVRRAWVQVI